MKKIIIIGCPGSGKSTFARKIREITGMPLHHLDMIYHKPDRTTISKEEFDIKLQEILAGDEWIIDGNYQRTLRQRLKICDTVFWLDYPTDVCLDGIESRIGIAREDMPWVETEHDDEFIDFIRGFKEYQSPKIKALLSECKHKEIYVFKSRTEANNYIRDMVREIFM